MSIPKLFLLFSLCCFFISTGVRAEEAPKAEGKETAKEGGKEGESALAPWVDVENKIQELSAKVKSKESNIEKLLEEKNHLDNDSPELKTAMKEVLKEHAEMRKLAEEYDRNVSLLKYRFPERNAKAGRKYDRIEVKSVDEIEQAMSVDGKLNRNMKRMRSQFKPDTTTATNAETNAKKAPTAKEKKSESIEDAGSVILQK